MRRLVKPSSGKLALSAMALAALSGCATVSLEQNVSRVNAEANTFTEGQLALARTTNESRQRTETAQKLLQTSLGQREAVQLALVNSPSLQALLAQSWQSPQMLRKAAGFQIPSSRWSAWWLVMNWS